MASLRVAQFVKALNCIDGSKRRGEVFSDLCELAYCALAKVAAPTVNDRDNFERQYMEVVARYQNKDDIRKMPELLAISYDAINAGGIDFLGSVAGELATLDAKLGQFFTPYAVSRMMAEIILQDAGEVIDKNGFITIQEPAVGAGGMLLAAADVIEDMGYSPERHMWIEATELSRTTYYMGFIQINMRGIAGRVICGNSLSLEIYTSAYTAAAPVFISHNGHPFDKIPKCPVIKPSIVGQPSQLSLFDL